MTRLCESGQIEALQTGLMATGDGGWECLLCGARFEAGEVYPVKERFFTAGRAAEWHSQNAHGETLERLLATEGKYDTLTDHQKKLVRLMAGGKTDAEIAREMGTSPATVRRQRFAFREKAKQARQYLAIYGLMDINQRQRPSADPLPIHEGASMMDDRFLITEQENEKYLKNAFESLDPPRLRALPAKEKKKVAVLRRIVGEFEKGRDYTEKEVNGILESIQPDEYVVLRRYLIEYGYMARERDGSRYWLS